jgi:NAD(P)H-flavin reductase
VRTKGDLFYLEEFEKLEKKYTNFECKIALSREDTEEHYHGYITDFVNENYTSQFQEAYLCGAPVVVDSMKEVLENVHFPSEYIFSEKY